MEVSDAALVQRAKNGDAECFAELFELHAGQAYGAAMSILWNRDDAEEVVQEAAIQAFRSLKRLNSDGAFGGWFKRIVVNKAIDRLRRREREQARTVELTEWNSPSQRRDMEQDMDLADALAQLPPEHQAIIKLHYTEGYTTHRGLYDTRNCSPPGEAGGDHTKTPERGLQEASGNVRGE